MGSALGSHGINIARMHLGRDRGKSQAIALISIDTKLRNETLDELRNIPGMVSVNNSVVVTARRSDERKGSSHYRGSMGRRGKGKSLITIPVPPI